MLLALMILAAPIESYCIDVCPPYGYASAWDTVLDAAIHSPECDAIAGCIVEFGAHDYGFDGTTHIACPVTLAGTSKRNTTLYVQNGKDGFVFHWTGGARNPTWPPMDPDVPSPYTSVCQTSSGGGLRDLHVRARPIGALSSTTTAVRAHSAVVLDRVQLEAFGHGLHVRACNQQYGGNANVTRVRDLDVLTMGGWAVYNEGCDANASLFSSVNVANACMYAGTFAGTATAADFACWGVRDRGAFNNTWVAPHVAYVCDVSIGCGQSSAQHPSYVIGQPGSTSSMVVTSPYVETTVRPAYVYDGSIVIGGSDTFTNLITAEGVHHKRRFVNGQERFANRSTPQVDLIVGDYQTGVVLGAEVATDGASNERLTWDAGTRSWSWRASGLSVGGAGVTALGAASTTGTPLLAGRAWLGRQGEWYEGRTSVVAARITGYATDPTTALGTNYPAGTTYTNVRAKRGDAYTWVLVCDGAQIPDLAGGCGSQAKLWEVLLTAGGSP